MGSGSCCNNYSMCSLLCNHSGSHHDPVDYQVSATTPLFRISSSLSSSSEYQQDKGASELSDSQFNSTKSRLTYNGSPSNEGVIKLKQLTEDAGLSQHKVEPAIQDGIWSEPERNNSHPEVVEQEREMFLPRCISNRSIHKVGNMKVRKQPVESSTLSKRYPFIKEGHYTPTDCEPSEKVAVIIPYR
ncbi:hypothetical protein PoB_006685900 [Plakobranchus ocellatus]|uniref:Galactosyltransferase N-terminal domain-containing protein n=1 Tax=Plakobranchus ocellatus TaxID=259542 RepID=A0AAV4D847_9GAST|nr:hypothetical protein PoB_006685900 [Plakobranchus ocellatus]